MATFVVTNTPQRGALGAQNPVCGGRYRAQASAAPGPAWAEVAFPALTGGFARDGSLLVTSSLDVGARLFVGDAAPAGAGEGWELPAGASLPLAVFPGDRVFVRAL